MASFNQLPTEMRSQIISQLMIDVFYVVVRLPYKDQHTRVKQELLKLVLIFGARESLAPLRDTTAFLESNQCLDGFTRRSSRRIRDALEVGQAWAAVRFVIHLVESKLVGDFEVKQTYSAY